MGDFIETHPTTCFTCARQNATTWRIVEEDKWREYPFIYVKITSTAIVLIDTGCGGASLKPGIELTSLQRFIEEYELPDHDGMPLNPDGLKEYIVILSHCHYDHIGAVEQFARDSSNAIWASSNDRDFLSKERLPTSSLCRFVGMETPDYEITNWGEDGAPIIHKDEIIESLTIYQTPAHTPDEVALWDASERILYVGDTLYEWAPIIFPNEGGDLIAYSRSLGKLRTLVKKWNAEGEAKVIIACGHITANADGETILREVDAFLYDVVRGKVRRSKQETIRGELTYTYEREDGKYSFRGPKRLFDAFTANPEAIKELEDRQMG